jgi:putative SOS response-associated peptidase YedK
MCGRYTVHTEEELVEIREILEMLSMRIYENNFEKNAKAGEMNPTDRTPVLMVKNNEVVLESVRWGFKKWDDKGVIINARSESIGEKGLFRGLGTENRCIIPATGFFEWKHQGGKKSNDKYFIKREDGEMLFMAGLYRQGDVDLEFVILTKEADTNVGKVHTRMPLIMNRKQVAGWFAGTLSIDELISEQFNLILEKVK